MRSSVSPAPTPRLTPSPPWVRPRTAARSTISTPSAAAADASDGVIHLAFQHDLAFSGGFEVAAGGDRRAVETFGDALAGSDRPLVIASGTLGLTPGRLLTEADGHGVIESMQRIGGGPQTRHATAELVLSIRCPAACARQSCDSPRRSTATVITASWRALVGIARTKGVSGYIGDGSNRWPAVHRFDAAHLCCLAVENAPAGSTLHAVADEGVPVRDIAEVIGRHLDVPVKSIAAEDAAEHFTWLAGFIGLDSPASSAATRELLDWQPTHLGLIEDLEQGHYFKTPVTAAGR